MNNMTIQEIRQRLLTILQQKSFKKQSVILSSGKTSNFYLDARLTSLHAEGAYYLGRLFLDRIRNESITAIGGMTMGADPIIGATIALSVGSGNPLQGFIVRKEAKKHGLQRLIEGPALTAQSRVLIIDDVVTSGGSTVQAIRAVQDCGAQIRKVICVVDREEGGAEAVAACGLTLESLYTIKEIAH